MTLWPANARRIASMLHGDERVRFLAVGAWNTLFGYLAFVVAYLLLEGKWPTTFILLLAYVVAMLQSFLTQKSLVFRSKGAVAPQLLRFSVTNSVIFAINALLLPPATNISGMNPMVIQAVFVVISTIATFFLHKHFSFK